MTEQELLAIEERCGRIREAGYSKNDEYVLVNTDVPALVAEVRRLKGLLKLTQGVCNGND